MPEFDGAPVFKAGLVILLIPILIALIIIGLLIMYAVFSSLLGMA